jgi:NAD(P)-dependent dehydrogenase (short-subunit alcohol dehydrogenase family)
MEQKVILLTGASGGMGFELAKRFAESGAFLALHSNKNEIRIPESERVAHFHADLRDESNCEELINGVVAKFGRIDVLINNAGISRSDISWKVDSDDWRDTMSVNLDAPFFLSRHALKHMRLNKWGRIINVSSIVAQTGFVGTSAYAASKAGLLGLTKTMAKEVAASGITVNALALGYFNVGMIEDVPAEIRDQIIDGIPAKRLGGPETVHGTMEWLMTEEAGYVTGQTINLNGGLHS